MSTDKNNRFFKLKHQRVHVRLINAGCENLASLLKFYSEIQREENPKDYFNFGKKNQMNILPWKLTGCVVLLLLQVHQVT